MASTSAVEPLSESRNWLELPDEIMGGMILQRLGAIEILMSAQKVCTTWRRICKDPAMWKIICIKRSFSHDLNTDYDIDELVKQAVHRSCAELIDITLDSIGSSFIVDYISRCITIFGLNNALQRLPHLEILELSYISISAKDIEVIGRNCPQLKSFKMKKIVMRFDGVGHAIANSMPALRHLQLDGDTMPKDDGIRAILNGCLHLESLDLSGCFPIQLDSNLEKQCRERIKDFKFKCYPENLFAKIDWDDDYDGPLQCYSPISSDDDYECSSPYSP